MLADSLAHLKRVLIFGGTFDPPHHAHLQLPKQVLDELGFEKVLYIPAGCSPHKLKHQQSTPQHRLAMLKQALQDQPHAAVLEDEVNRPGPSYTIDTLRNLKARLAPDAQMRLLIGTDQARVFESWKDAGQIIQLAEPVVMVRPPDTLESLKASFPTDWASRFVEVTAMNISATQIRQALQDDQLVDELLPSAVLDYIQQHTLYQD